MIQLDEPLETGLSGDMPNSERTIKRDRMDSGHRWGVILAGGDGKRLLPLTRQITGDDRPKQFCRVMGRETLLLQTRTRVSRMVAPEQTLLVLTRSHECFYLGEVDDVAPSCLLIQPQNRGTAPAILYSLARVQQLDPKGRVAFFPADHYFSGEAALEAHIEAAFAEAETHPDLVILLGIAPEAPEVEYGWIQPGTPLSNAFTKSIFHVACFWEKPSRPLACSLMKLGCLWNSFIMVGRVQAFLGLIRRAVPALWRLFFEETSHVTVANRDSLCSLYSQIPSMNFSQDILAACPTRLAVLGAEGLGWSDLGDPGRVLSILARKGVQPEWNLQPVDEEMAVRAASA